MGEMERASKAFFDIGESKVVLAAREDEMQLMTTESVHRKLIIERMVIRPQSRIEMKTGWNWTEGGEDTLLIECNDGSGGNSELL